MNKKLLAVLMVLTMLASLVLSGFSFIDTRIAAEEDAIEEDAEEDAAEEDVAEDAEEESESNEYTIGAFTFIMPESEFEVSDYDEDFGYLFTNEDETMYFEFLADSLDADEEITQEDLDFVLESTEEAITGEIEPYGRIHKSFFNLNGMSAVRVSYSAFDEDFEIDYDLDMTVLVAKKSYAVILAYVPAENADADYVRFLDEILFSVKNSDTVEEEEAEAEAPEGAFELAFGETATIENMVQITPEDFYFVEGELLPSITDDYYSYIDDVEDETYIVVTGTVKNLSGDTIDIEFGTNNKIVVNGTYTYTNGILTAEDEDHNSFYGYEIKPLKSAKFVYYVSVPDELIEMYEFCEIEISFNDLVNYVSSYEEPEYKLYLKCE